MATGHYARVKKIKNQISNIKMTKKNAKSNETFALMAGVDKKKDQSYFLYQLRPDQLEHIMFPLGEMTKKKVREEAKKRDLVTADKPDSVGICFIGDINVRKFLEERIEPKKGEVVIVDCRSSIVDTDHEHDEDCYRVVGEHDGAWFYTIGQRSGFSVKQNMLDESGKTVEMIPPFYVIEKDVKKNRLVVGFGEETLRDKFEVEGLNWVLPSAVSRQSSLDKARDKSVVGDWKVRIRHGGQLLDAEIKSQKPKSKMTKKNAKILVKLREAQRGVAPGQACVFYKDMDGDMVLLGGGVIG